MNLKSLLAGAAALVFSSAFVGVETAHAQLGTGGASLGGGSQQESGAGVSSKKLSPNPTAPLGVVGPAQSRLPLVSEEQLPPGQMQGLREGLGEAGSSSLADRDNQAYTNVSVPPHPYSTARVAVTGPRGPGTGVVHTPVTSTPYRQSGKLYMRFGTGWYVCTASLIGPSILVTAAHCVHDYGQGAAGWADDVVYYPSHLKPALTPAGIDLNAGGPWGGYRAIEMVIPTPYFNGTDTCETGAIGVVCNNDIAVLALQLKDNKQVGVVVGGWYDYGWNGYSSISSAAFGNQTVSAITQLGYPLAIDGGIQMLRNDSFGRYVTTSATSNGQQLRNTELGSLMTGGSSGGPWLVNFGTRPTITGAAQFGTAAASNVVVGVTSWGYTSTAIHTQGASFFGQNYEFPNANYGGRGAGNIGALVNHICTIYPGRCAPL